MARWCYAIGRKFKKASQYSRVTIAFLLVASSMVNITYAWLMNSRANSLYSQSYISVSADGIIMQGADEEITNNITVPEAAKNLVECTSENGRNIFFPASDPNASDPIFRKSSVSDRNTKYIAIDFTLSVDKRTNVWISNESYILGAASDAIRLSIDWGGVEEPVVLDGSLMGETETAGVLSCIRHDGTVDTVTQKSYALSEFYFNGDPEENKMITLEPGVSRRVTVTVWLEGFDSDCNDEMGSNPYKGAYGKDDLRIQLKFTAGMKDSQAIRFRDCSYETWAYIKDPVLNRKYKYLEDLRVFVRDTKTNVMYAMYREPLSGDSSYYQWTALVPDTVKNVEFVRHDYHIGMPEENSNLEYWFGGDIKSYRNDPLLYYHALDAGSFDRTNPNGGSWSNVDGKVMMVYFLDGKTESTATNIYFQVRTMYANGDAEAFKVKMTHVRSEEGNGQLYAARIFTAATSSFSFEQIAYGIKTDPIGRGSSRNLYTLNADGTGVWSTNAAYPTN